MTPESNDQLDLTEPRSIHVIGIGGAGMRAIASVLATLGHKVSGSDLKASAGLDRLAAEGIDVAVGHDPANLGDAELVARSTAVDDRNVEVRAARERGVPVLSRADVLTALTRIRPTVAVAGTHGKTTTSSMLAVVLTQAGLDPSFVIGGEVNEIGSGAIWGDSESVLVVEADESDGTFLRLDVSAAIVTSVEPDHLGHYGGEDELRDAFAAFVEGVTGPIVLCIDDAGARALAGHAGVVTYGTAADAEYRLHDYRAGRTSCSFELDGPDGPLGSFTLPTPGLHNARNATAAVATALHLGADLDAVRSGIGRFAGVARRFQFRGEKDGVAYVDDYAHLPSEVAAALEAASGGDWGRIVCVFQPHRYSRTAEVGADFAGSFDRADEVVITGIYSAGEQPVPGVSGRIVADAVTAHRDGRGVRYVEHRDELVTLLVDELRPGDLCLTLGAGDLTTLADELLRR